MAEADIYIDCDSSRVVTSADDNQIKGIPRFVQGDTIALRVHLLQNFSRFTGFEVIPTTGVTIQVAIRSGLLSGSGSLGSILAAQYSWTAEDGLYFSGSLALNTAEISTALTSAKSVDATFELKFFQDGAPTTALQIVTKIWKAIIDPDSVLPVATPTPLSSEVAQETFVRKIETEPVYLEGADGSLIKLWNDNGVFKADLMT